MPSILQRFGPATIVTAAFIGPGTVITCSVAGANYGYTLMWALVFSIGATMVLQEMTARLAILKGVGLAHVIRDFFGHSNLRIPINILCILAIWMGNAAYQSGNITGTVIGMEGILSQDSSLVSVWVIGLIAFALLYTGKYQLLEKVLISLVGLMSLFFVSMAFLLPIDFTLLLKGLFIPTLPDGSTFTIIALVGTTIVPYNLFLHSSAVAEKWKESGSLRIVRVDLMVSVMIGGIVSLLIILTSAATIPLSDAKIDGLADLSNQLEPILGGFAPLLISGGIFAAGLTSSITAPLAAAYTVTGILGKKGSGNSWWFRGTWISVLLTGLVLASLRIKPLFLIQLAQFTNGLILPFIGAFLIMLMNNKKLGNNRNGIRSNLLGIAVLLIITFLGIRSILTVLKVF
jgi:Mn2+/Fe2+ NRAMP family transporter